MSTPPIHDAVTAVLTHGDELFIVRRPPNLAAFPGYWAFPGGKVDRTEREDAFEHPLLRDHPPRLMRALVRELREEVGLDLEVEAQAGRVTAVVCIGQVTTPAFAPHRFRTWFYRVDLRDRPALTHDAGEIAEALWASAALLRERFEKGRLLVVPPTRAVIERFAAEPGADWIPDLEIHHDAERQIPWIEAVSGLRVLLVQSNTIPPADRTNAFIVGDAGSRRVLIDPSPSNREELARLYTLLDEWRIDEVFLTHHHPDHREHADEIARRYRVPIGMSQDTRERIQRLTAGRFFADVETRTYAEGDVLTQWQGEPVDLFAVPGHDEGQLAVMPRGREWCLVSDLFQGVGTVVIGGAESSMRKYFDSLRRVIDLDPNVVIPSHGMAMGTTYRIRETLRHREMREKQVQALHQAGKTPEQMVPEIYAGLDPRLLPLARMNVESHLAKLREDGAL